MDRRELAITAELANIELSDSEIERFALAVEQMIEHFAVMAQVDISDDLVSDQPQKFAVREDRVLSSTMSDEILGQVPELEDRFIVIPNIL